tara:strand:+ start:1219 stop:1383 length:165 start_codon:yes stop_codon:yes gene_type:complete
MSKTIGKLNQPVMIIVPAQVQIILGKMTESQLLEELSQDPLIVLGPLTCWFERH